VAGDEFLVYAPDGGPIVLDLSKVSGSYSVEWFNPATGHTSLGGETTGGRVRTFKPPFGNDAVLYLVRSQK
jgi:hypothetical protein